MLKPIVHPFSIRMIPAFPTGISSIWTQTICLGEQCLNLYPLWDFVFSSRMRFLEVTFLKLQEISDDAEDGYIFEVDLHYPTHLHDRHDDYPFAPESSVIDRSMYSSTRQAVFPESAPQRKLTPNLQLKLYLQLGLVVTKVHRVLTFKQSPWLKAYIDFNTRQCSLAGDGLLIDEPCNCRTDYRRSYFTQMGC